MNRQIRTVIIAPMTTQGRAYLSRVPVTFQAQSGYVVLDQLRTVDKRRLLRRLGAIERQTAEQVCRYYVRCSHCNGTPGPRAWALRPIGQFVRILLGIDQLRLLARAQVADQGRESGLLDDLMLEQILRQVFQFIAMVQQ